MDQLKQGNQILKGLRSQATIDKFEDIYADHRDQKDIYEQEAEIFGEILDLNELEQEI